MKGTVQLQGIAQVIRGVSFDKEEVLDEGREGYLPVLRAGNIATDLLIDRDLVWVPEGRIAEDADFVEKKPGLDQEQEDLGNQGNLGA